MKQKIVVDSKINFLSFYSGLHNEFEFILDETLQTNADLYIINIWDSNLLDKIQNLKGKVLLLDNEGEDWNYEERIKYIEPLIKENIYFISARNFLNENKNIVQNLKYLNLFYYFHRMNDGFYFHPPLPEFELKHKKYDFISYLGLQNNNTDYHIDDKAWRKRYINSINFNGKTRFIPKTFSDNLQTQQHILHNGNIMNDNWGAYNWYSLIESEQAKIKIVFETLPIDWGKQTFFSEKTVKCLIHSQPYFLIVPSELKNYLEEIGFELPKIDLNELCRYWDIDVWIKGHKEIFVKNKKRFYNMIHDETLPHCKFIKKILERKVF